MRKYHLVSTTFRLSEFAPEKISQKLRGNFLNAEVVVSLQDKNQHTSKSPSWDDQSKHG